MALNDLRKPQSLTFDSVNELHENILEIWMDNVNVRMHRFQNECAEFNRPLVHFQILRYNE